MNKNFRSYTLAVAFCKRAKAQSLPYHLKDQLSRASSSIALNLAEGYGRLSRADKRRFYIIAFGSIRECQSIVDIGIEDNAEELSSLLDSLAAHVYKLIKSLDSKAA